MRFPRALLETCVRAGPPSRFSERGLARARTPSALFLSYFFFFRTEHDRYVLGYCFSGSRLIELFEALLRPLFELSASTADAQLGRDVLERPEQAFASVQHTHTHTYRSRIRPRGVGERGETGVWALER